MNKGYISYNYKFRKKILKLKSFNKKSIKQNYIDPNKLLKLKINFKL